LEGKVDLKEVCRIYIAKLQSHVTRELTSQD